eukprot:4580719-Alexandrium_andersonii.AAC.1
MKGRSDRSPTGLTLHPSCVGARTVIYCTDMNAALAPSLESSARGRIRGRIRKPRTPDIDRGTGYRSI